MFSSNFGQYVSSASCSVKYLLIMRVRSIFSMNFGYADIVKNLLVFAFSILFACTRVRNVTFNSKVPCYLFNWEGTNCVQI